MCELNTIDQQSPDLTHEAMTSRYEAIQFVHKERGSFIAETHHYVSPNEPLPFYVTEKTVPHLFFRPLSRTERRHIQDFKNKFAQEHANKLTEMLDKFNEMEVLEEVSEELAKGRVLR